MVNIGDYRIIELEGSYYVQKYTYKSSYYSRPSPDWFCLYKNSFKETSTEKIIYDENYLHSIEEECAFQSLSEAEMLFNKCVSIAKRFQDERARKEKFKKDLRKSESVRYFSSGEFNG